MTAIKRLNEILSRMKRLDEYTTKSSNYSRLMEIASFMDDLPDITQQLETAIIELEENE